jgi:hypothetical protein
MPIKKTICLLLICIITLSNTIIEPQQQSISSEYSLKAVFIYRFTDYIDWSNNNDDAFNIGVIGESPIISSLGQLAKDKKIKNKSINIRKYDNLNDINSCQLLFISRNSTYPIETIISKINNSQILIICEQQGYASRGAHINFVNTDNKLKFEINLKSVAQVGLRISSQLLQHAILVE